MNSNFENSNNPEKLELLTIINKLKVQSIIFGAIALLGIFVIYYFMNEIKEKNRIIKKSNDSLEVVKDIIFKLQQSDSVKAEAWRLTSLELGNFQDSLNRISKFKIIPKIGFVDYSNFNIEDSLNQKIISASQNTKTVLNIPNPSLLQSAKLKRNYIGYLVYIHDRESSKMSLKLQGLLQSNGFSVPSIEHIPINKPFGNSIKYFHEEDKKVANEIRLLLIENFKDDKDYMNKLRVFYLRNKRVPLGQFEIWIDK